MKAAPEEQQLQAMLNGVDIPPCPAILLDLDAELRKDEPDQRELARLITSDVALSGHVMQIANSPAFSTGSRLSSISQALTLLGTRQVFNLVVSQLLRVAMADKVDAGLERFWESSAQTARLCGEIARRRALEAEAQEGVCRDRRAELRTEDHTLAVADLELRDEVRGDDRALVVLALAALHRMGNLHANVGDAVADVRADAHRICHGFALLCRRSLSRSR